MPAAQQGLNDKALSELERILMSPPFRSSPRCQQFLRFVVERAVEGRHELLKERMIGIEVFGRDPSYQTEGDSVVRTRATDVRKRLQQFYSTDTEPMRFRIDIPAGSYAPVFQELADPSHPREFPAALNHDTPPGLPSAAPAPAPALSRHVETARSHFLPFLFLAIGLLGLLAVCGRLLYTYVAAHRSPDRAGTVLREFWGPALNDSKPVLLCIGSPVTYTYSRIFRAQQLPIAPDYAADGQVAIVPAGPAAPSANIVPVMHQYVGAGDANAATLLSAMFARLGKTTEFRIASETSYAELSDSPAVLIGAFSNRWTMQTMAAAPFGFVEQDSVLLIRERGGQGRTWRPRQIRFDGKTDVDYAIVSRILDAKTGQFLVTAAGLTSYGSRAAGYFITHPDLIAKSLGDAPQDWPRKNLQLVLESQIVDGSPTSPEVVARQIW